MKRTPLYIILAILVPLFSSCIYDDVLDMEKLPEDLMISFSMDVNSQAMSKATNDNNQWNDSGYDQVIGNDFEKRINISDLLVFAYTQNGAYIGQLPILKKSEEGGVVKFLCAFKEDYYKKNGVCKIVVLANCINSQYRLSYDENDAPMLDNLKFTAPINLISGYIPMVGIKTHALEYSNGAVKSEQDLGAIVMLRAMSKVGVRLHEDLQNEGFEIKPNSIKLNYARSTGFSLPGEWKIVPSTSYLTHSGSFNPTISADEISSNVTVHGKDNEGGYYMYVPETENGYNDNNLSISLTVIKGNKEYEFDYTSGIKFCNYVGGLPTGSPYDVMRNHFYDFTVTSIETGLELNVNVAEWEDAPVWDLDFSAPMHSLLLTAPTTEAPVPQTEPVMYYDNSDASGELGAFVGYFKMDSPVGMTWRPTLANASTSDYEIRVYKNITDLDDLTKYNVLVTESAISAERDYFYKIVVVPTNPNNSGNVVKLGITYTADWNAEANPLLIINKGNNNGRYYPWTGTDALDKPDIHWISIKQIDK